jgi:hypothetical protein
MLWPLKLVVNFPALCQHHPDNTPETVALQEYLVGLFSTVVYRILQDETIPFPLPPGKSYPGQLGLILIDPPARHPFPGSAIAGDLQPSEGVREPMETGEPRGHDIRYPDCQPHVRPPEAGTGQPTEGKEHGQKIGGLGSAVSEGVAG